jgi:hypothetical protein
MHIGRSEFNWNTYHKITFNTDCTKMIMQLRNLGARTCPFFNNGFENYFPDKNYAMLGMDFMVSTSPVVGFLNSNGS